MINIEVTGGTKKQRELAESLAYFCVQKLMPKKKTLDVTITLGKLDEVLGWCLWETATEFSVDIEKKQSLRRLLETVAHEMVHVKQYATGELYESTAQGKHRWQGKWLKKDPEYYDRPWEIEAHGREVGLFVTWAEAAGHASKDWAQDPY